MPLFGESFAMNAKSQSRGSKQIDKNFEKKEPFGHIMLKSQTQTSMLLTFSFPVFVQPIKLEGFWKIKNVRDDFQRGPQITTRLIEAFKNHGPSQLSSCLTWADKWIEKGPSSELAKVRLWIHLTKQ